MLPISRGGRNQWNNLVAACLDCNRDKGSLTATEYAQVIEARRAETRERFRAQHESTVAKGDAPKGDI
jgi:5-methylcytosine-specific restriction endonuclease McrA